MSITSEHLVKRMHQHAEALPGVSIRLSEKNIRQLLKEKAVETTNAAFPFELGIPSWQQAKYMRLSKMRDDLGYWHPERQVHTVYEPDLDPEVYDG